MRWLTGFGLGVAAMAAADEGMWLFNQAPKKQVEEKYGFTIEQAWLDHLQASAVRINSGGSGSFVSSHGLLLTNHHVGAGVLAALSTPDRDLVKDGFLARSPEEELPCGDLELNVLISIRDVTSEMEAAVNSDMDAEEMVVARRALRAKLEMVDEKDRSRLLRDVVSLYQGGKYHLYEYRRYTDVRLVFAPERQVAAFGGDADNFEYPRYCLDCCFFRAYEDDVPAEVGEFLRWSEEGAKENELVFVAGHPGSTERALTHAQVLARRNLWLPYGLERLYRKEVVVGAWCERDKENQRRGRGMLVGIKNGRKARRGSLEGMYDPGQFESHAKAEAEFRERLRSEGKWESAEAAFIEIETEVDKLIGMGVRGALLGGLDGFDGHLFSYAWTLVEAAKEREKPDPQRRSGYREVDRVSLELHLFSPDPVYKDLEQLRLTDSLMFLCEKLGADDPMVVKVLGGKSPKARARELVEGCRLDLVKSRKDLYQGDAEAIEGSDDPMLGLVRVIYDECHHLQDRYQEVEESLKQSHAKIARARFAMEGDAIYPDATFSLRLSVGTVLGIGEEIPFHTTYAGLFARASKQGGLEAFELPQRWQKKMGDVEGSVALNFISSNDITGGNSGSPVVNKMGELVGLVFDGNLDGLVNRVRYDDVRSRAVSVDSAGMLEALRYVYRAEELVAEILGK